MRLRLIFLGLACLMLSGCTDDKKARSVLQNNGYKDVDITGYRPFTCSKDDSFATGFTATSPTGQKVSGAVCSGLMKGATIRFD